MRDTPRDYFKEMSRAMATLCDTFATVMHSESQYQNPPMDGIWGQVEFAQLQTPRDEQPRHVQVDKVSYLQKNLVGKTS